MQVEPYLFFNGRCEEAIEFYRKTVGAEVQMLMRFKESPDPSMCAPGTLEKVMHASLRIGGNSVMVSDGRCQGQAKFEGFALSASVPDEATAKRVFAALGGRRTGADAADQDVFLPELRDCGR